MSFRVALIAVLLVSASQSFAQVIYEPVRYQYGDQKKFYYGGSDPRMIEQAMGPRDAAGRWGRVNGYDFVSSNIHTHREVNDEPERVYTDALGFENARIYGFTANDARNEAYANIPTYFRKADLLRAAVPTPGAWIVPAQAQPIPPGVTVTNGQPTIRLTPATTRRASFPKPLFIIPKKALEKKIDAPKGNHVASATEK
jgi:hypothetical protein